MSGLPFRGSKKNCRQLMNSILETIHKEDIDNYIFVDLFGGSGIFSVFIHELLPTAYIVYNDFDHYIERLQHIPQTNEILDRLRPLMDDVVSNHDEIIKAYNEAYDKITIATAITFTNRNGVDSKHKLYNKVPKHNYKMDTIKRYDGLVIEHLDYHDCIHKYDDIAKETNKTVILIIDPPFMNTSQTYYKTDYFNINDYFEVVHLLYTHKYIYFEDIRNDIIRLSNTLKKFINQDLPITGSATKDYNTGTSKRRERIIWNL